MPKIDAFLFEKLVKLAKNGTGNLDEASAEKLFNLRLIDYVVGSMWKVNIKGLEHIENGNK